MSRGGARVQQRANPTPEQQAPDGARVILLTRGFVAWVDEEDYELISRFNWYAECPDGKNYYARTNITVAARPAKVRQKFVKMHRMILVPRDGEEVDHVKHRIDIGVIDNRKSNLRSVSSMRNSQNRGKFRGCISIFKGVTKHGDRWSSRITVNKKTVRLGLFTDEGYAALCYDLAAVKHFGESAITNFPVEGSTNWIFGPSVQP